LKVKCTRCFLQRLLVNLKGIRHFCWRA